MDGSAPEEDAAVPVSDPDRPSCPPPAIASSPSRSVEEGGDQEDDGVKVYIVPYRWLREAWESSSEDTGTSTGSRGVLYTASAASSSYRGAMKIINFFNSDLVFNLRREEDSRQDESEAEVSGRSYALVRTDMWLQALRWTIVWNITERPPKYLMLILKWDSEVDPKERQSSNCDQHISFSSPNESIGSGEHRPRTSSNDRPPDADTTRSRPMTPSHEGRSDGSIYRSQLLTLDYMSKVFDEVSAEVNGARGSGRYEPVHVKKKRMHRFCCLSFN